MRHDNKNRNNQSRGGSGAGGGQERGRSIDRNRNDQGLGRRDSSRRDDNRGYGRRDDRPREDNRGFGRRDEGFRENNRGSSQRDDGRRADRRRDESGSDEYVEDEIIFGRNAVLSFLDQSAGHDDNDTDDDDDDLDVEDENNANQQPGTRIKVNKVYIASGMQHDKRVDRIRHLCRRLKIPIVESERRKLDAIAGSDQIHQGVVAQISQAEFLDLEEFLEILDNQRQAVQALGKADPFSTFAVAVLDGIEDPHNLGAIVRVGEAAGLKGIILPLRRSAGLTATVAKTSAGALASMPIVRITNLTSTLERLKEYGFWTAGLSVQAKQFHFAADLKRPLAIVIGSEGQGMSRLVEKNCDMLLKIPMLGKTESLNASVAAGIVFYEFVRQNGGSKE